MTVRRGAHRRQARVRRRRADEGSPARRALVRLAGRCAGDLRHAARLLRRDPLFTLTAMLSLAIGIGANTTIFTVAQAVLFRPPAGVAGPAQLVDIGTRTPGGGFGNSSYPNYLDLRSAYNDARRRLRVLALSTSDEPRRRERHAWDRTDLRDAGHRPTTSMSSAPCRSSAACSAIEAGVGRGRCRCLEPPLLDAAVQRRSR